MSTGTGQGGTCATCGAALDPGAAFCASCGARTTAARADVPTAAPGAGQAPAAAPAWSLGADVDDAVAPVWRRLAALVVDQVLAVAVGAGATATVLPALRDGSAGSLLVPGLALLVLAAVQWFAEGLGGATAGGALLRIRTVSARTGRAAGLWAVLVRSVVQALGLLLGGVGVYVVAASGAWDEGPEQRGWHDKAAGTLVLRTRPRALEVLRSAPSSGAAAAPWSAPVAAAASPVGPSAPAPPPAVPSAASPVVPPPAVPSAASPVVPPRAAPSAASPVVLPPAGPPAASPAGPAGTGHGLPETTVPTVDVLGDLEHTRLAGRPTEPVGASEGALVLVLDTGERVEVTGPGLVGRRPAPEDAPGARLVVLADPGVSRVHLAYRPLPDGTLEVTDRGATNGTVLLDPAGTRWALPPDAPARVAPGWTLLLGPRRIAVTAD